MKQCVILIGPPGSGKTSHCMEYPNYIRVSQDDEGPQHKRTFYRAIKDNKPVIIDRMNFNKAQRKQYIETAKEAGYTVTYILFLVPKSICHNRMLARSNHPTIKNEENALHALNTFFRLFEYPTSEEFEVGYNIEYKPEDGKIPAIIVDLDGTLADNEHRTDLVRGENKNWNAFFDEIPEDAPNIWCSRLIDAMDQKGYYTVFCTGRPEEYRSITENWLNRYEIAPFHELFMRPSKDYRQDSLIKNIILDFDILPQYNVLFAVDDRKQVVDMWRKNHIVCLQCAPGEF